MRRMAVIGLSVLLASCGGPPVTPSIGLPNPSASATVAAAVSTPAPPSSSAVPTSTPAAPSPSAVPAGWTSLRWSAPVLTAPYETISDIAAWNGGYVAVGQFQNNKGGTQAAAWFSTDWQSWTRTLLDLPRTGDSTLWHVFTIGSGLVAIGSSGVQHCVPPAGEGQVCDPQPIGIWTSTNGLGWRQAPTPAALTGLTIDGVASDAGRLVLAGHAGWNEPGVWTSRDGSSWDRESLPRAVFAKAHFFGLAVTAGGWILTGDTGGTEPICCDASMGNTKPAAWFSPDGLNWTAAQVEGATTTVGLIDHPFVGRDGLVAVGARDPSRGWISTDGRAWTPVTASTGGKDLRITPWASDGTRIVGHHQFELGDHEELWVSTDGVSWSALGATGAIDRMPAWSGTTGAWADAAFLFPAGVGLIGQNGTERFPIWFAQAGAER